MSSGTTRNLAVVAVSDDSPRSASAPAPAIGVLADHRIAVRRGSSVDVISATELVSAHSNRNVTRLVTEARDICIYVPFREAVQVLAGVNVVRIHRGIAVNVARVRRIVGRGRHRLFVVLDSGCELTVGRAYQAAIRRQFGGAKGSIFTGPRVAR